ncbi:hypothetical protein FH063_003089 [Azospirillum argentinense]|uniref:Uncharacterized protein n=1 Tax=Azospirillum argentinense TaxID=2970906 RepID=A0A5B0KNQ0_9PROT|nr:hypothetical protein FH063_003089 [Azospirillum argentinense]
MGATVADLVSGIIDWMENRHVGPGRQPMSTVVVIKTLRFFPRGCGRWVGVRLTLRRSLEGSSCI